MGAPDAGVVVAAGAAAMGLAGMVAPFGVTAAEIGVGIACMVLGSLARTGFALQASLEGGNHVQLGKTFGALSAAVLTSPFLATLSFAAAHVAGFSSDPTIAIFLLVAGYSGPEFIKGVLNIVRDKVLGSIQSKAGSVNSGGDTTHGG